ncbi:MAG TPA: Clp protease N-terminal domain-containing protein [Micromonosporaceae bacterium]|nr:Clp protease N-terminal domain-containing protein [Micromonosporaceae bacterium]
MSTDYVLEDIVRVGLVNRGGTTQWQSRERASGDAAGPAGSDIAGLFLEATWNARRQLRRSVDQPAPRFSSAVVLAVRRAIEDASVRHLAHAHKVHLLTALLDDTANRANERLRALGIEPQSLLEGPSATLNQSGPPIAFGAMKLYLTGHLNPPHRRRPSVRQVVRRWHHALLGDTMPMITAVELEAMRHAARLDHHQVGVLHLLLAIIATDQQIHGLHWNLSERLSTHSSAAELLTRHGARYDTLVHDVLVRGKSLDGPIDRRYRWRRHIWSAPTSSALAAVVDRTHAEAEARHHRDAGTDHMLWVLLSDDAGPCVRLLEPTTDIEGLRRDVRRRLDS